MTHLSKKLALGLMGMLLALALAAGVLYAVFTSQKKYSFDMDANANAVLSVQTDLGLTARLSKPGDTDAREVAVANDSASDVALAYDIRIAVKGTSLSAASGVILWLDGRPAGVLRQLLAENPSDAEYGYLCRLPVSLPLAPGETRAHTVAFEYHVGAAAAGTQTIEWKVSAEGRTDVNFGSYLFAKNEDELRQIARQNARSGAYAGKTVYLCGGGGWLFDHRAAGVFG